MARSKGITGLKQVKGIWTIDKIINGKRLYKSTGTSDREEAERFLIHVLEEMRKQEVYGIRRDVVWREVATRYLIENINQPSNWLTATALKWLDPFIGDMKIDHIDNEALQPFIQHMKTERTITTKSGQQRKLKPASNRTINLYLERVIHILHVCSRVYRHQDIQNRPFFLDKVPLIKKLDENETKRPAYPISWDEQTIFFGELPLYLRRMALFKVNTGTREQEVCKLRWDWEIPVPELGTSVFLVPGNFGGRTELSGVKNGDDRLVVLNRVAKSVIDAQRIIRNADPEAEGAEYVFPFEGRALHRMNDTAWDSACKRAAIKWKDKYGVNPDPLFATLRVHDLKHTFGRRLRAADVTFEDRQALLGHKGKSVTTHYSQAELENLLRAANKVCDQDNRAPTLLILKRRAA